MKIRFTRCVQVIPATAGQPLQYLPAFSATVEKQAGLLEVETIRMSMEEGPPGLRFDADYVLLTRNQDVIEIILTIPLLRAKGDSPAGTCGVALWGNAAFNLGTVKSRNL
ncbi:MAG: hypothetical protein HRT77_08470 [Halioglobus sp.]|nr:hypothetical protein [Halioglobus sp.]